MEIVVDANVFLNVKDKEEPFYSYSERILNSIDEGRNRAILSTVVLAEICCGYYLTGETKDKDEFVLHVSSSQKLQRNRRGHIDSGSSCICQIQNGNETS